MKLLSLIATLAVPLLICLPSCHGGGTSTAPPVAVAHAETAAVIAVVDRLAFDDAAAVISATVDALGTALPATLDSILTEEQIQEPLRTEMFQSVMALRLGTPPRLRHSKMASVLAGLLERGLQFGPARDRIAELLARRSPDFPGLDALASTRGALRAILANSSSSSLADRLADKIDQHRPLGEVLEEFHAALGQQAESLATSRQAAGASPGQYEDYRRGRRDVRMLKLAAKVAFEAFDPTIAATAGAPVIATADLMLSLSSLVVPAQAGGTLRSAGDSSFWDDVGDFFSDAGDVIKDVAEWTVEVGSKAAALFEIFKVLSGGSQSDPGTSDPGQQGTTVLVKAAWNASSSSYSESLLLMGHLINTVETEINGRFDDLSRQVAQVASLVNGLQGRVDAVYTQVRELTDLVRQQFETIQHALVLEHEFVSSRFVTVLAELQTARASTDALMQEVRWLDRELTLRAQDRAITDLQNALDAAVALADPTAVRAQLGLLVTQLVRLPTASEFQVDLPITALDSAPSFLRPVVGRTLDACEQFGCASMASSLGALPRLADLLGVSLPITTRPANYGAVTRVALMLADAISRRPDAFPPATVNELLRPVADMVAREHSLLDAAIGSLLRADLEHLVTQAPAAAAEFASTVRQAAAQYLPAHNRGGILRLLDELLDTEDVDPTTHHYRLQSRALPAPTYEPFSGNATAHETNTSQRQRIVGADYTRLVVQSGVVDATLTSVTTTSETWRLTWHIQPAIRTLVPAIASLDGSEAVRIELKRPSSSGPLIVRLLTSESLADANRRLGSVFEAYVAAVRGLVELEVSRTDFHQLGILRGELAVLRHLLAVGLELGYADTTMAQRIADVLAGPMLSTNAILAMHAPESPALLATQLADGVRDHMHALATADTPAFYLDSLLTDLPDQVSALRAGLQSAALQYFDEGYANAWFDDAAVWIATLMAGR